MINRNEIKNPDEILSMYFNPATKHFVFEGYEEISKGSFLVRTDRLINLLNFADNLVNFRNRYIASDHDNNGKLPQEKVDTIIEYYSKGNTQREIAGRVGVSLGVVNKYIRKYGNLYL